MSDSDSDGLMTNNVFTFQNENTFVSAKGPNANITGISFPNNVFSSTLARPYERQRYAESSYDQRSIRSNWRETSPMSVRSACDMRQRNFNYSFNHRGVGPPRSAYNGSTGQPRSACGSSGLPRSAFNGRGGSPMSVRSIDTCASTSAIDIANALKTEHFNENDIQVIKQAFNMFKHRVNKKLKHRRYHRVHRRKKTGYDSGEQGSNSSLSSDDRSVRSNMSSYKSTRTDISNFKRKIIKSNMLKDCTNHFKHNSIQNAAGSPKNLNTTSNSSHRSLPIGSSMTSFRNRVLPVNFNNMQKMPPAHTMSQKDRFTSGYQLPSQRFNRSGIPCIPENVENEHCNEINSHNGNSAMIKNSIRNVETDDDEDIFCNTTKQKQSNKRSIDSEDAFQPNEKRIKTLSPCKNSTEALKLKVSNDKANDFVFAKPICPARKSVKEKLISKSAAPLLDIVPQSSIMPPVQKPCQEKPVAEEKDILEEEQSNSTCNSTNVSSFIRRKLFTQTLDVSEKRNLSMDGLNSPQNNMYAIQKDKHKPRKLQQATTQSCLSRDILQNDNNLLDLINKIVPIDQMNVTNQTNKTGPQNKNTTKEDDKWDVTSIMSTCKNDGNESETYTDEEIFNCTEQKLRENDIRDSISEETANKVKKDILKQLPTAKILLEKLQMNTKQLRINHFWDTDFESDTEFQQPPRTNKLNSKDNHRPDILQQKEAPKTQKCFNMVNSKKPTTASILSSSQNFTFNTTQKFNSTLNIKAHRAPKRNKLDQTTDEYTKPGNIQESCITLSNSKSKAITVTESKKSNKTTAKIDNKKSPKGKKQTSKNKQNQSIQDPKEKKQHRNKTANLSNKTETTSKKTPQKLNTNSQNQNKIESKKSTKNIVETKVQNKKSPKTKKASPRSSSVVIEENNNESNRAVRLCRTKSNQPVDKSNLALNETINRTLRSRKLDLSTTTLNKNKTTAVLKDNKNNTLTVIKDIKNNRSAILKDLKNNTTSKLSDVSFSLTTEKNAVVKRILTKLNDSCLLNADESDVSFSLNPTPRKTRSSSRNKTSNSTPLKSTLHIKELLTPTLRTRKKIPNKRYMY